MKKKLSNGTAETKQPGAFLASGSWSETATLSMRGKTHGLVDRLVTERRNDRLTPRKAAMEAESSGCGQAFPNREQWLDAESWRLCRCTTSAEAAVMREGRGCDGHWCGERYLPWPESECQERERHRPVPMPDSAKHVLGALFEHIDSVRTVNVRGRELTTVKVADAKVEDPEWVPESEG